MRDGRRLGGCTCYVTALLPPGDGHGHRYVADVVLHSRILPDVCIDAGRVRPARPVPGCEAITCGGVAERGLVGRVHTVHGATAFFDGVIALSSACASSTCAASAPTTTSP